MSLNRFAVLDMGDEDDVIVPPEPSPIFTDIPPAVEAAPIGKTREWNLEKRRFQKPFSRGHAFHGEKKTVFVPLKTYAFQDDEKTPLPSLSPELPLEAKKTTTPEVANTHDFPKLSDYERPRSPPYPPDDREYPTLAERLKRAIEKDSQFVPVDKVPTMEMVTVIPVRTKFNSSKISSLIS